MHLEGLKKQAVEEINIAKLIARSGICSRRDAKRKIDEGAVLVNGKVVFKPTTKVAISDVVEVDGKRLPIIVSTRVWMLNKPKDFITTTKDPFNRQTVFSLLPKEIGRVVSIGRLDVNSEGLLLFTNDGEFARNLELPQNAFKRVYRARVFGKIDLPKLQKLKNGCVIDGIKYGSIDIEVLKCAASNSWILVSLNEGKNREVRKVLAHCGLQVNRLIRIKYGPYELQDLNLGDIKEVGVITNEDNCRVVKRQSNCNKQKRRVQASNR